MQALQERWDNLAFFRRNQRPLYYVSTTIFNVVGADEWVHNLSFINTIDSFDGRHPRVFVAPPRQAYTYRESKQPTIICWAIRRWPTTCAYPDRVARCL
jgi:hypothetical protein